MDKQSMESLVRKKYEILDPLLNERSRRIWAASEAMAIGWGGQALVSRATGIHKNTVNAGVREAAEKKGAEGPAEGVTEASQGETVGKKAPGRDRVRKKGGGRKRAAAKDPTLAEDIKAQVEASTRWDPESALLWSSKSTRKIADALNAWGERISHVSVAKELAGMGYSLQSNRKTKEGWDHPDRDAQFSFINEKAKDFQKRGEPVISVDAKKKENVGNFKNAGREYHPEGKAPEVNVYDFIDKEKGKVAPYGVYDLDKNKGWVSVGISSDTAEFAVNSIRSWWYEMWREAYPDATEIYINADGGGSNGSRCRLWKVKLQELANELSLTIHVSHFPPGTSKWNKIEHRMFCFISQNWRGHPLIDRATVVNLIGKTSTKTWLRIRAKLDDREYPKGIKISDAELEAVALAPDAFHGEWNYKISPVLS